MIDEKATKENVKQFFKNEFDFLILSAGFGLNVGRHTVLNTKLKDYDQIASSYSREKTAERARMLKKVITAMSTDERTKAILFGLYVEKKKNYDLIQELGFSQPKYNKLKSIALLKFADNIRNLVDLHGYK